MSRRYVAQYPDQGTEKCFDYFLGSLSTDDAEKVARAILSLEDSPRPSDPSLHYLETEPEKSAVLFLSWII